jgi:hypothetical protein
MATRTARFSAIPAVPQSNLNPWEFATLNALKENVEILTGARGDAGASNRALIHSQVTVNTAPTQNMTQVSAKGTGFTISGVSVPSSEDYIKLVNDVQNLANDVANIRATLNTLIQQLKA